MDNLYSIFETTTPDAYDFARLNKLKGEISNLDKKIKTLQDIPKMSVSNEALIQFWKMFISDCKLQSDPYQIKALLK